MITDEMLRNALDRIARTPDGELLYLFLQKRMIGVLQTTDSGALLVDSGARNFAQVLMSLMTKGIEESGGRQQSTDGQRTERPIVFAPREPVSVRPGRRGTRRRIPADGANPDKG